MNEATLDANGRPLGATIGTFVGTPRTLIVDSAAPETSANLAAKGEKVPVDLVPPALTLGAARAFAEGAKKYGPFSWRRPEVKIDATTYAAAMLRHLYAWMDGEDVDPDSTTGKTHVEGIAATVGILLDVIASGTLIDNRRKGGPAPTVIRGGAK